MPEGDADRGSDSGPVRLLFVEARDELSNNEAQ